jgi:uncharacterized protein (TIGR00369 family)
MNDVPDSPFWRAVRGETSPPPSAALLGWKVLETSQGAGQIRIEFRATEQFTNVVGNIQGGFLAAMLDDTLGPALVTVLEPYEFCPTLELKVSFLRPARPGRFVGEGRVVHRGNSIGFLEGRLLNNQDEPVATATSTVRILRLPPEAFSSR